MNSLLVDKPEPIGFDSRLQRAFDLLKHWTETDKVPAAALCVGRRGKMLEPRLFGRQRPEDRDPIRSDALFLIASPTKPITVLAAMLLVERGQVSLEDNVATYVPKFGQMGKEEVQVRHLMTHTSGLPDMLPNNDALRAGHKPLAAFIDETCKQPLLFPPGTKVNYQSMGTALLAEIVHQVSGSTLADFLKKEVFDPLGLADTSLGWQPAKKDRIAGVRISPEQQKTDWNWQSPYWLGFGAPWGGLIAPPAEYAKLCLLMLGGGVLGSTRILSPATVRAMTINQLALLPQVPEEDRRCRPWGLGWRLNWPGNISSFGDLLGPRTFGHWGATGTMVWMDPDADTFCVLFTTQPLAEEGRFLARVSNIVAAAIT
jgi:CubicO group peptidase (beta-lactamase class C family)